MSKKLDEMISSLPSDRQARIQKRTMTLVALKSAQQTNHSALAPQPTAPAVEITPWTPMGHINNRPTRPRNRGPTSADAPLHTCTSPGVACQRPALSTTSTSTSHCGASCKAPSKPATNITLVRASASAHDGAATVTAASPVGE